MSKLGLLVLLTCVTSSIHASVIPTQKESGLSTNDKTTSLVNEGIKIVDSKTNKGLSPIAPEGIYLGKPISLLHQKPSLVSNSPTVKDGESHPNSEAGQTANISVISPTQLNPVEDAINPIENDVVNKDNQKKQGESSVESKTPSLKSTTKARKPIKKPSKPTEENNNTNSKPSNQVRPNRPQNKPTEKSQQPEMKKSSTVAKPAKLTNRDKPSKPNVGNANGTSGSIPKPDKPNTSNTHHKPQGNSSSSTAKTVSGEALNPEHKENVARPKPQGNSNTAPKGTSESQNSVGPNKNIDNNVDKATIENFSLPISADITVNKDSELNPTTIVSAVDKSPQASNADQIQNQLQAQIELIQSQIQGQQQHTQSHVNQPQSAVVAHILADPPKIPSGGSGNEETSVTESEKTSKNPAGLPETKDFHKQIVSKGQYVIQVQNITHTTSTQSIVTSSGPSNLVENTMKLEIMKPINSQYLNPEEKAQAIMESLVLKVPPSPVKDVPSCKDKETIKTDNKDAAKPSEVVTAIIGAENKPEELVYEVEEILEAPGVVPVVPLQTPTGVVDSAFVAPLVQNPEIGSPANEMPVDQDINTMPQLPPNVVELISQLYALTSQSVQSSNQPQVLQAADQNNVGITTVTSDNQTTNPTLAQVLAALITAMTINSINQQNNGLTISGIQNTPSASAASVASINAVASSPYAGVQGSYVVPINYVVTAYPQLMPYLAPYVLVNGYPQGILAAPTNVSSNIVGTEGYIGELTPSSSQILSPDSDSFVEEVPMNEEMKNQEKNKDQLQKHHQNFNNAQQNSNKEKPGKPTFNDNPSKPSSVLGRPQNSTTGSQSTVFGLSPGNSLQHVSVLGNSNPQNSQNNNNIVSKPQLPSPGNQNFISNADTNALNTGNTPQQSGNVNTLNTGNIPQQSGIVNTLNAGNRPQQSGNVNTLNTGYKPQQTGNVNTLNTGNIPQQAGIVNTLNTGYKPQETGNVNTLNTGNIPQQAGIVNTLNTGNRPQQSGTLNTLNTGYNPQQSGNVNTLNTGYNPQQSGNVNTLNTGYKPQQSGNSHSLSSGNEPGQSGNANSLNTGDKHEQGQSRPPFAGKPTVTISNNNNPQGSSLAHNQPQSSSAISANKPQSVTGLVQPSLNAEANKPFDFPQQNNNNPNAIVISTMGQFLEHESQQQSEVGKVEIIDSNKPVSQSLSHPHATHGHGIQIHPQQFSVGNKPRPGGGHGYLIPPKSADNGVNGNIQPNHQIEEGLHKNPATAAGDSKNPGAAAGNSNNLTGVVSSNPSKPGTSTDAKRPNKPSKPVNNSVSKPAPSPSKHNKPQFGLKKPVNKQEGSNQDVLANSTLSGHKPRPVGWQLPKWPSFSKLYQNVFGTRQRAAETEDEVSGIETTADNCTPGPVAPRNKQDNRPLCGVDLPKEAYTCEKLCSDSGFNVGTCHADDSCVCSYSEASEIGLKMEFYYDRNMTSWEDYYPSYESCSRCTCLNQCTETGYFMGTCGNTCYCGRPFENGVPLDLYTNPDQIFE